MSKATDAVDKSVAKVNKRINAALHLWARQTQDDIKDRFTPYSRGRVGGDKIQMRSGTLIRDSFKRGVFPVLGGSEARVWSDYPYISEHEKGRTITAKNAFKGLPGGPYLSFPTHDNTDATGGVIVPLSRLMPSKAKVYMKTAGGYVLGERKNGDTKVLFHLRKSVKVEARLHAKEIATKNAARLKV